MNILIVIDMQNDFIDGSLGTPEALAIVDNVCKRIEEYRGRRGFVVFTRDTHYTDYSDTLEGLRLPIQHCIYGTKGWELAPLLDTKDSVIINKSSFGSIELANYVKSLGNVDSIELVGLCTDICVISNALILRAALPNAAISVNSSCCAGVSPASHATALDAMRMCQIDII